MNDLPPQTVNPHHTKRAQRRHRFRVTLAALAVCAMVALLIGWLAMPRGPGPSGSSEVAISLPPPAAGGGSGSLPSFAPSAGQPNDATPEAQPASPGNPSSTQTAMLPPRPQGPAEPPAWLRFATTAPVDVRDRPRVAIVMDDLGLDRPRTERVIALPKAVTLSFLAYSGELQRFTDAARRAGHEMIVHVPMEPVNAKMDMGPNGLSTNQPKEEVLRRLNWDLARFDGYVGINNHMGSRFTGDAQAMTWVMDELKARGLMFLDSRTIANSIGAKTAAAQGVPFAERDVFLDDEQTSSGVDERLKEVEAIAKKKGTAIAIGHPHDVTIQVLSAWIASLPQKGIVLVPLTDIVKTRMGLS